MPRYPGNGKATLLKSNSQVKLFDSERLGQGVSSIAVQLERIKSSYYPWGSAFEVRFAGAPGTFEVDIMGAEDDNDNNYVALSATALINAVNSANVGRYDMLSYYPKFVRIYIKTLTNDVAVTAVVTR